MKLVKFTVEKYRSILSKSVLPIGDYTAILGPNNQGKSNLLRALSIALRVMQFKSDYFYRRGVRGVRHIPSFRFVRELYDWDVDYPIQWQHDKRIKDDSKRLSKFVLDFKLDATERDELGQNAKVKLSNDIISVKLELGQREGRFAIMGQKRRLNASAREKVVEYLSERINICFIDAERTAETARQNITDLIELPIRKQFETEEYRKFIDKFRAQQDYVLSEISNTLKSSLKEFLPAIKSSKIQIRGQGVSMRSPLAMGSEIFINDGVETALSQKGSGVQSLIAISIANYISQSKKRGSENLILAIEEPETHLHPMAVHQVKETLEKISYKTPVIITTHSPLLVNLKDVKSNIIVNENEAAPAKSIREIRDVLGVQRYDNLTNAECVVMVEGLSDVRILDAVFRVKSERIAMALNAGQLIICNAQGCSKMSSILATLKMDCCKYHIVLDNDSAARTTYEELLKKSNVLRADITLLNYDFVGSKDKSETEEGSKGSTKDKNKTYERELEDTIDASVYWNTLREKYALPEEEILPKNARTKKWSDRMRMLYNKCGGVWSQDVEDEFKSIVADKVVKSPADAIRPECLELYNALIKRIQKMLTR